MATKLFMRTKLSMPVAMKLLQNSWVIALEHLPLCASLADVLSLYPSAAVLDSSTTLCAGGRGLQVQQPQR